ncbi:TetR family transcriptional regulator [Streptomyces sp. NPDC047108]|uniref:TetR/AcrR family transcriptional regulator n=1 Tax=Streptomyces sp. NPDC047108 TaxID=3155025 RepID=UPI0033DD2CDF
MAGTAREDSDRKQRGGAPVVVPRPDGKGERTRQRILQAARETFGRVGYDRATIRMIASAADADKSSVMQYFGTKEQLFREAVRFDIPIGELTTQDPESTAENYLRTMLGRWATTPDSPMAVLMRTSMTSEESAELLRHQVTTQSVDAIARNIDLPDARLRAGLFSVIMLGIASGRYLLRVPDVSEPSLEDLIRVATPVIRALIAPEGDGSPDASGTSGATDDSGTSGTTEGSGTSGATDGSGASSDCRGCPGGGSPGRDTVPGQAGPAE